MFPPPLPYSPALDSAVSAPASRRRVSRGSTSSSMNPSRAAIAADTCSASYSAASRSLLGCRVVGGRDRLAVDHAHRLLRAHDPDLGVGPGEREVGAQVLRVHRDEAAAVGLAQHHGHLRHHGLGERVQQLRAVADHAEALLLRAGQEAGRVDEHHQRHPVRVAGAHELRGLLRGRRRRSRRRGTRAGWRSRPPRGPSIRQKRRDHVARPARGHLEHLLVVHDRRGSRRARRRPCARRRGTKRARVMRRHRRGQPVRRRLAGALRQVREQLAHQPDRLVVVRRPRTGRRRSSRARFGPPSSWRVHVLADHLAHHARAGEEHRRALGHDDEVGERGRVRAAAGRHAA